MTCPVPDNEVERVAAVETYHVTDTPRELTFEQSESLRRLARQTMAHLELRRKLLELSGARQALEAEKGRSDELLLNILPAKIAEELKSGNEVEPRYHDSVTIMFTDFKGFTRFAESLEPRTGTGRAASDPLPESGRRETLGVDRLDRARRSVMRMMKAGLAVLVGFGLWAGTAGISSAASQMSEKDYRAALEACKKEATAKLKDECVSNAKNRYERGMGAEKKASGKTGETMKGGEEKAKGKAETEMKGAKDKGAKMMESKGKKK